MIILDVFRQLYLLLWKNFTLRKRKKLRLLIELIWPLFLFLILMWVRTRGLKSNEPQCHFAERPLPSAGILPFVRGYICNLNFSCSQSPQDMYSTVEFTRFTQLTTDTLTFLNQPTVIESSKKLAKLAQRLIQIRSQSAQVTKTLTLSQSLKITNQQFKNLLNDLYPDYLNDTIVNTILNSNPNYNYLYSNYTTSYNEPIPFTGQIAQVKPFLNILYGPDLQLIDLNRQTNQVDDPDWIRSQTCFNNTNYLLKGNESELIKNVLCRLNDGNLTDFFVLVSEYLDISKVKRIVYDRTDLSDPFLLLEIIEALYAYSELSTSFSNSNLSQNNGFESIQEIWDNFTNTDLKTAICGKSQLSIFSLIESIDFGSINTGSLNSIFQNGSIPKNNTDKFDKFEGSPDLGFRNFKTSLKSNNETTFNFTAPKNITNQYDYTAYLLNQFNNLNVIDSKKCPINRTDADLDPSNTLEIQSTTKSCFCQTIYAIINSLSDDAQVFFVQIKPLFLGKILYSPNTPVYNKLVKQINKTLTQMDSIVGLIGKTAEFGNELLKSFNGTLPNDLPVNSSFINLQTYVSQLRFTTALLYFIRNSLQCIELNKFEGHANEQEVVKKGLKLIDKESFWAGLVFENPPENDQLPKIVKYKIRMNASMTHDTSYTQDKSYYYGPSNCLGCNSYFMYGFIYLQDMVEKGIVEMKTNSTQNFGIIGQMMPYPCFINDKFLNAIARTLPLFMVLAWIFTVSMMVKDIVYEKEKRLKEFMRVMSLSNGIHWVSWFITSFITMFIIVLILCLIIKFGNITSKSDFGALLVFFTCFTLATITQCFLISVFFNQANLAAVVAGIIYFLLYLPYTILVNYSDVILPWQKFLASLSSTVAFSYGCEIIAAFEKQNVGITWQNFYETPYSNQDTFTMNYICLILLLDSVIYMFLTWYIEGVAPGEFGLARKWYFPIQPSFWCGDKPGKKKSDSKLKKLYKKLSEKFRFLNQTKEKIIKMEEEKDENRVDDDSIEKIEEPLIVGVEIEKLHKVYSRGNNHALKGLSVKFYRDEISAFLGHNGAGKSTTMHLLTGLYSPTSGHAKIDGLDITESMDMIRKSIGFVPQYNVLFPGMTVKEHLWFFARLKGLDRESTKKEMEKMLDDTGLRPKKNEFSRNLSGGMQRKLSVAIAFVGGSKTVILDEPSAGVDPAGRRSIWDLLFKYRKGRSIIISTHHMDEADVLGDRIAIISNGRLIAHGTSYFLKQKFGKGYYLTFAKKTLVDEDKLNTPSRSSTEASFDSGARSLSSFTTDQTNSFTRTERHQSTEFDSEEIDFEDYEKQQIENEKMLIKSLVSRQDVNLCEFVKRRIENAVLVENIGSEMTFSISNQTNYTKNYEKFFQQVEKNMENLGIDSIGISDTTLEEIFIKLAKEPKKNKFNSNDRKYLGVNFTQIKKKISKCSLFKREKPQKLTPEVLDKYYEYTKKRVTDSFLIVFQQLYALLIKRLHRVKRNKKGFFAEIVLPVIFVCLALLVATLSPKPSDRPPLELHPWYYPTPNVMFFSRSSSFDFDKTFYSTENGTQVQTNPDTQFNINEINQIYKTFIENPGPGTRCMKGHKIIIYSSAVDSTRVANRELDCEGFENYIQQKNSTPNYSFIQELLQTNYTYSKRSIDCDCSTGFPECPVSAGGDIFYRDVLNLKTKDILYDLTGRNVSDWLIKTELNKNIFKKRYGGYEFLTPKIGFNASLLSNFLNTVTESNTNFDPNSLITNQNVKLWYNTKGYDANVAYLNILNNAFMRSKLKKSNFDPREHGIVAINHPMSFTRSQFLSQLEQRIIIDLFVAVCIIFALSFIPASFLVFLLEERANNSKQLQFVSGVRPYIYWISNYVWDLLNYIIPTFLCIIIFLIFDVKAYMSKENFPCLIGLMLLYGWACIPLMYPLNYVFKVPSTAFVISSSLNVFIGVVSTMTTTVLTQLGDDDKELLQINKILKPIFIILFPHYCLGQGFIEMAQLYTIAEVKRGFGYKSDYNPFEFDKVGRNLLALGIQGVAYFTLNLLIQYKFFVRFKPEKNLENLKLPDEQESEDEDVRIERNRILENIKNSKYKNKKRFKRIRKILGKDEDIKNEKIIKSNTNDDFVRLVNLTKIYKKWDKYRFKKHVAVNDLCLGINKGECFGLIGVNGAGKTTSFKMITGEISMSGGDVFVNDYSVSRQIEKVHQHIGYCPQTDAIIPLLTAREHLVFFARLRGIPEKYVNQVSEWAMHRVGLTVFADRISGDFSGGNKRKLSTAIALVGNPSVVCLDEPTSGMDAKARRLLWNDIISLIKENRVVILTSHSMEECEALCTRLVIMVNGKFKCIGSPQHLKSKFGNGYKLSIRLNDDKDKINLKKFMKRNFPTSKIQETHRNLFEYVLPFEDTKLSHIFGRIESNRDYLNVKDYSVSQTTLDQVFINFAKLQNDEPFLGTGSSSRVIEPLREDTPVESSQIDDLFQVDTNNNLEKTRNSNENDDYEIDDLAVGILPKKDGDEIKNDNPEIVQITRL
nr:ATP-binding cassette subfamily A1-like 1 [Brachionus rubens]